jgi:oxygen-dependent protoporphyrinogen oxidase
MQERAAKPRIAIIGGGITGLSAAYYLSAFVRDGLLEVDLFEASSRFGGVIETIRVDDCLIESGPDSFITNKSDVLSLAKELGLENNIVATAKEGRGAYVVASGKLVKLPEGFVMLAPSKLLPFSLEAPISLAGKLRALAEPFIPARQSSVDESLANFVRRRFGWEVLEALAQPMVAGVYVGDAETLSAQCTAERFVEMERTRGSVTAGLCRPGKSDPANVSSGARYGLFASFDQGLGLLVEKLVAQLTVLGVGLHLNSPITGVERLAGTLQLAGTRFGGSYDALFLALPARTSARLINEIEPVLAEQLAEILAASSCVINFVFEKSALPFVINGFGAVIPEREIHRHGYSLVAFSFASKKYPGRAPENKIVMRAFQGGVKAPEVMGKSDEVLIDSSLRDLRQLLGAGQPLYANVHRWPCSMPQYLVGHRQRLASMKFPEDIFFGGASYTGVGLPDCVASGRTGAEAMISALGSKLVRKTVL